MILLIYQIHYFQASRVECRKTQDNFAYGDVHAVVHMHKGQGGDVHVLVHMHKGQGGDVHVVVHMHKGQGAQPFLTHGRAHQGGRIVGPVPL